MKLKNRRERRMPPRGVEWNRELFDNLDREMVESFV